LSPILVRPVREQLEHDRVIRLLQAKYKRKFDVAINPGNQQTAPVGPVTSPWYPDLVLQAGQRTKKLAGVVEVETVESINHLEAMSQWTAFARMRVPFHLYVPASGVDAAKRLCASFSISTAELWSYHAIGEQIRFTLVLRSTQPGVRSSTTAAPRSRRTKAAAPRKTKRAAAASPAKARTPAKKKAVTKHK
jgi:hypothetical protein